jgi:hypothetical protein
MKRRSLFLTIAAGLLVSGIGALDARAGYVPLPTTLDKLLPSSSNSAPFTTVQNSNETDTFSNFTFSVSAIPPTTPVLAAGQISVSQYGPIGIESGFTLSGAFFAPANTIVDYKLSYIVSAPPGFNITDALLSASMGVNGGTGSVIITELLTSLSPTGHTANMEVSTGGVASQTIPLFPSNAYFVQKDILLNGGSMGATASIINQAFSSTNVPEPGSMALLGIGMTGFLAFRRLFKRHAVA